VINFKSKRDEQKGRLGLVKPRKGKTRANVHTQIFNRIGEGRWVGVAGVKGVRKDKEEGHGKNARGMVLGGRGEGGLATFQGGTETAKTT